MRNATAEPCRIFLTRPLISAYTTVSDHLHPMPNLAGLAIAWGLMFVILSAIRGVL
jgi:hypothetical protein